MDTTQSRFFQMVKSAVPVHLSLAEDIAALLNISTDSAYRRIRGEKTLSLEEAFAICNHYPLPWDGVLQPRPDVFTFKGRLVQPAAFRFEDYLQSVVQQVQYMSGFRHKKMYYLCKDIPLFHHFHFRELAAFKYYFWMRTILHAPEFTQKKFSMQEYPDAPFRTGQKALHYYNSLDSVEIWNIENINSTIHQVAFYEESGIFASEQEIFSIYKAIDQLLHHLEAQASLGYKFDVADPARKPLGEFQMYFNEVISGDNSILAELDGTRIVYLTHNVINFMITTNESFCNHTFDGIQNLMQKSTLISSVSEQERARFFNMLRERIAGRMAQLGEKKKLMS